MPRRGRLPNTRRPVFRNKYHAYFERTGEGADPENPQYRGSYYRTDHGPVTILTLNSTNGVPDEDGDGEGFHSFDVGVAAPIHRAEVAVVLHQLDQSAPSASE
ncbi:hypothetical protein F7P69_10195 [Cellulosimicrobium funkei]|nr:hypothetical protein [Cellulosimicrobium funkei]